MEHVVEFVDEAVVGGLEVGGEGVNVEILDVEVGVDSLEILKQRVDVL